MNQMDRAACPDFAKAEALDAGYRGRAVLEGLSFSLKKGELISLIGPNGSGKSTLLLTFARQLLPVGGLVFLEGKELHQIPGRELAKTTAVLFTERLHREDERVESVVSAGRYPYTGWFGLLRETDRDAIRAAMELTDILELGDRNFNELSDGQKQRVLLARALTQKPRFLILDEPTSFLDLKYQLELMQVLRRLSREEGISILLSLHEISLAARFSDRVLMLKKGKAFRMGPPEEVMHRKALAELFDLDEALLRTFLSPGLQEETEAKGRPEADREAQDGASGHFANSQNFSQTSVKKPGENYASSSRKGMRKGFTSGTSAALAAQGAAHYLLSGELLETLSVMTPAGIRISLTPESLSLSKDKRRAACTVRKDAGDDPDRTNQILITAEVEILERGGDSGVTVKIDGGEGVGRVTKPGLDQPVGSAAINSTPRRQIQHEVLREAERAGFQGGLRVLISAENGREIAAHTMNPILGIEGGISILGTSGIVEPMSEKALIDSIEVQLKMLRAEGYERVILTPGNIGRDFLRAHLSGESLEIREMRQEEMEVSVPTVSISNFIGDALDLSRDLGFQEVLLVGHAGKLVKLAGGVMNTHSRCADGRQEFITAHAALLGADRNCLMGLMRAVTVDACLDLLEEAGILREVEASLTRAVQEHLTRRAEGVISVGAVLFTSAHGIFGITEEAEKMLPHFGFSGAGGAEGWSISSERVRETRNLSQ